MKLCVLTEDIDASVMSYAKTVKLPSIVIPHEVAWVGRDKKIFHGGKNKVEVRVDPSNKNEYVSHTHPADNPSEFTALPSVEDLRSAVEMFKQGFPGVIVFSGEHFTIVKPRRKNIILLGYEEAVKKAIRKNDIDIALDKLRSMGFDVGIGKR